MTLTITQQATFPTRVGDVHVATAGKGSVELLVVTPIGSAWMAAALPEALGELFTVRVCDLPGTGRSQGDPNSATVTVVADAITDVGAAFGEFFLFGHSMNGTLALATAAATPCRGVIAVAPSPFLPPNPTESASYWEAKAEPERRRRAAAITADYEACGNDRDKEVLREHFDRLRRWYDLEFDPTELDRLAALSMEWIGAVFESGKRIDWPNTLRSLSCPVFLGLGEYDFIAPPTAWTEGLLPPSATVKMFPRSGHTPYVEQPAEFVDELASWVAATLD